MGPLITSWVKDTQGDLAHLMRPQSSPTYRSHSRGTPKFPASPGKSHVPSLSVKRYLTPLMRPHLLLEGCFWGRNSLTLLPGPCSGIFPRPGRKPQAARDAFSVMCLPACRGEHPGNRPRHRRRWLQVDNNKKSHSQPVAKAPRCRLTPAWGLTSFLRRSAAWWTASRATYTELCCRG